MSLESLLDEAHSLALQRCGMASVGLRINPYGSGSQRWHAYADWADSFKLAADGLTPTAAMRALVDRLRADFDANRLPRA